MCILPKENKRKAMKLCCGMTQDQNSQSWVGSPCQEEKKKNNDYINNSSSNRSNSSSSSRSSSSSNSKEEM